MLYKSETKKTEHMPDTTSTKRIRTVEQNGVLNSILNNNYLLVSSASLRSVHKASFILTRG